MKKEYTARQMELWGNLNMMVGAVAITAIHLIFLLLGISPLDWFWQGILLCVLVPIGLLYYRLYKQTKKETEE